MIAKKVRLQDIADSAGTSKTTVSRVLSNKPGSIVSKKKREEIKAIAEKLGYVPNRRARLFSQKRNNCIGFIMSNQFFQNFNSRPTASLTIEILSGVTEYLSKIDHTLHYCVEPEENAYEYFKNEYINEDKIDGLVYMGSKDCDPLLKDLQKKNIPYVSFAHDWESDFNGPTIGLSYESAFRQAAEDAYNAGHRRLGCISQVSSARISRRRETFFNECSKLGIEVDHEYCVDALDETQSYMRTRELIRRKRDNLPSLFFYTADHWAILGMRAMLEEGLKIPEDVSVIGYDGAKYTCDSPVPLSTIYVPRKEMGEAAVKLLLDLKENPDTEMTSIILPCRWMKNMSLGKA
ncbi:MAG: LacI family DNA-binding transcriptional regulator [Planctomycetota bacterium]|jgi:DNA-binding LacI/PurR family transcriptional regulator